MPEEDGADSAGGSIAISGGGWGGGGGVVITTGDEDGLDDLGDAFELFQLPAGTRSQHYPTGISATRGR